MVKETLPSSKTFAFELIWEGGGGITSPQFKTI